MIKEMMYKIFPKLLAKAISDEQEHNQKQQEEIAELQSYDERLKHNFYLYSLQEESTIASGAEVAITEGFTIPEDGTYSIGMTARFEISGSGVIRLSSISNNTYLDSATYEVNSSHAKVRTLHIFTLRKFNKGELFKVNAWQNGLTACTSTGGRTGMYITRLN